MIAHRAVGELGDWRDRSARELVGTWEDVWEDLPSQVTVYCRLDRADPALQPGMTGYARIDAGSRPIGRVLFDRVAGLLRTEFWW